MSIRKFCARCDRVVPLDHTHRPPDQRPSAARRGYGSRWKKTRERFLRANPLCTRCGKKAVHVHHIDGMGPLGPSGYEWQNLEGLCHPCHSQHTAATQPGGFAA